jgi:MFS family permease
MGLVHNFSGLMTAVSLGTPTRENARTHMLQRWWLGVAEAGLFPGVNYYLSCWLVYLARPKLPKDANHCSSSRYKRSEFGIRAAIFFSAAALAGSFGGLLAAAIAQMDGIGGKPGWAWIFVRFVPFYTLR